METKQQINELMEKLGLHDKARNVADMADWYKNYDSQSLSELCRYAHRTVCDLINKIRDECETFEDIKECINAMRYDCFNSFKYYQSQGFMRFAELEMTRYRVLGSIFVDINAK